MIIYFFYKLMCPYIRNSLFAIIIIQFKRKKRQNGERLYMWMW